MEDREDLILLKQLNDKMDQLNSNIERLLAELVRQRPQTPLAPPVSHSENDIGAQVRAKIEEARRQAEAQFGSVGKMPPGFGVK